MINIPKKSVLHCVMNNLKDPTLNYIRKKGRSCFCTAPYPTRSITACTVCFIYRASRLKVAVAGDFPGRTTVTSVFHVPSMLTPALYL